MPDRDQHVDRLLREAMAAPVRAESANCLDVETIAAWSDGSLRTDERARAEMHAATCTRCQSMLAAMIRMEPVVAAASPSPFRKWLVMLGPALGAAAAVALWFAIDRPARSPIPVETVAQREQSAASVPQQEKKERESAAAPSSQAAPAESPKQSVDARSPRRATEADRIVADADERKREAAPAAKPLDRFADAKAKSISGAAGRLARREGTDNVGSLPPVAPPPTLTEAPRQDRAQAQAQQAPAQTINEVANQRANQQLNQAPPSPMQNTQQNAAQTNQPAAGERRVAESPVPALPPATITTASQPARDTAAGAGRGQAAGGVGGVQGYLGQVSGPSGPPLSTLDVPTSDPATRYRALLGRTIQRSTDGGRTWRTLRMVTPPAVIVAGASPAPAVCWLAVTGGIVLSTADGVTWREAKLPEAGEIKSIAAVDANTAAVILTDGRMLTTTNGGTSWARPR